MKNKLLLTILTGILVLFLSINSIQAAEWDNKLTYSEEDLKVTLRNSILNLIPTSEIGTAELKSHKSVSEWKPVGHGDTVVMWYDFNFSKHYTGGLGNIKILNLKNNKREIPNKAYSFVYWGNKTTAEIIYNESCGTIKNGTYFCEKIDTGKIKVIEKEGWLPYDTRDIPKGNIRIGVKIFIEFGDRLDIIWNVAGKEISKHAVVYELLDLQDQDNTGGSVTTLEGMRINVTSDSAIINVTIHSSPASATKIYLYLATGTGAGNIITTADISSRTATFTSNATVNTSNEYFILAGAGGSNYDRTYYTAGAPQWWPVTNNQITGIKSVIFGGSEFDDWLPNIRYVYTSNTTDIEVTALNPTNEENLSDTNVSFSGNIVDTGVIGIQNVSLLINGTINQTNSSHLTGFYNWSVDIPDGFYNYSIETWGNDTIKYNSSTLNFSVDTSSPLINLTFPLNITNTTNYTSNATPATYINYTVLDPHLDTCWFEFNGSNTTLAACANTTAIINYSQHNFKVWANDSSGNLNYSEVTGTWEFVVFQNDLNYSSPVLEGASSLFYLNFNISDSGLTVSDVHIVYNGTDNVATKTGSFPQFNSSKTLIAPGVSEDTNLTAYWAILLSDGFYYNSSDFNQTVLKVGVDNCSVNTNVIYNYTVVNEETQIRLDSSENVTTEINLQIYDVGRNNNLINFSQSFNNTNPFAVCLSTDLLSDYVSDTIVKYQADDYSIEYYNLINSSIVNGSTPINITLYDLILTDATEFRITFTDETFLPVENALVFIDRQYISENNSFKTVELPKTDSNGQTIGHFVANNILYNIRFILEGVLLGNFENVIAFCEDATIGNCQIVLNAVSNASELFDYNSELGIIFDSEPSYNSTTNLMTFDFVTDDGSTATVTMEVSRNDLFGNLSVCNSTLTTSSGTLSCSIDPAISDTNLKVNVLVEGTEILFSQIAIDETDYGSVGFFAWFILTFFFIFALSDSKTGVLSGIVISYIGAFSLGWTLGGITGIGSAGIWITIVSLVGIWKLNKDIPQ